MKKKNFHLFLCKERMNELNKKLKMIGLSMVMTLSMFLVDFGLGKNQALAETHAYDGKSPYYNSCASSAVTKDKKWIDSNSYVELKFSTVCKTMGKSDRNTPRRLQP